MIDKGKVVDIMQTSPKVMFKFLCFMTACSFIGLSGCRRDSDGLEDEPLSEVLLRYTPEVGQTNHYRYSVNLDKKFFLRGKWRSEGNEKIEGIISIKSIEQDGDNYLTRWGARIGKSNLSKESLDMMKDVTAKTYDVNISDRYVCNETVINNLCFPDEPIMAGTEWEGEGLFSFGDMLTVNKPTVKMSYRLIKAVENKDGRYCIIENKPLTTPIELALQVGQLGLKCDATAKVIAVREDCDAQGKIKVGDVLVGINGQKAITAKDWHDMYERFIESPDNAGSAIVLTIRRDGREQDVSVRKSFVTLGTMEVNFSKDFRKVIFDIDKGIIISDESSSEYDVMYFLDEFPFMDLDEFPFMDDYMGNSSFKGRAKTREGPRNYRNQWKMKLLR
jgi:hypothetical protein